MPRISEFYGILVYMYYRDHHPPHFHAMYAQFEAEIEIQSADVLAGRLPRRALSLVVEWCRLYQPELLENWDRARKGEPLQPIPPLD